MKHHDAEPFGSSPDPRIARMIEFEPFDTWVSQRIFPIAQRGGRAAILVYSLMSIVEIIRTWTSPLLAQVLIMRLCGWLSLVGATAVLGSPALGLRRVPLSVATGMLGQVALVYLDIVVLDRLHAVPFVVVFFLFGALIVAPALTLRTYLMSAAFTVLHVAFDLYLSQRQLRDYREIGIMVLPALAFLGLAIRIQRDHARQVWSLTRENHIQSSVDALSLLLNRRAWYERAAASLHALGQKISPAAEVGFLMLDIDHFKRVNDTWGHECGDIVIRRVADILVEHTRAEDLVGRLGGEEFGILLAGSPTESEALEVAERIRASIEELQIEYRGRRLQVTASLGLARTSASDPDALVRRGDECLYAAKRLGRNRVVASWWGTQAGDAVGSLDSMDGTV